MNLDLSDEEAAALTKHLRQALDEARYPARAKARPAQIRSGEARPSEAPARSLATAESGHGAEPWAGPETVTFPVSEEL
jgi:hypothetical protein